VVENLPRAAHVVPKQENVRLQKLKPAAPFGQTCARGSIGTCRRGFQSLFEPAAPNLGDSFVVCTVGRWGLPARKKCTADDKN
jgi:hypothetical protein